MKGKSFIRALVTATLRAPDFDLLFVTPTEFTQLKHKTQQTQCTKKPSQSCSSARRASRSEPSPCQAAHPAPNS